MASTDPERKEEETSEPAPGEDEDTGAQVAPIVRLEEVAVTTGEEEEEVLLDLKAKLYRFDKEGNQWKERGGGTVKLLKHKETGKVRLVMRQSKTLKICANHYVLPSISIQEHAGNDKSCVWHAPDYSNGELKEEFFCIRFGSVENCRNFMEMVEEIAHSQAKKDEKDGNSAADLIDKLSVTESKTEEAKGKEGPAAAEEEKKEASSSEKTAEEEKKSE
ncbi:ran-binding protein 1 homolog c-like [Aristolochia californica]|uniref:ran-binding protein 1 homolog c-like n=1 Tax=Aristolochia californica TaxID=171875 RepID=UPI0035DF453C